MPDPERFDVVVGGPDYTAYMIYTLDEVTSTLLGGAVGAAEVALLGGGGSSSAITAIYG